MARPGPVTKAGSLIYDIKTHQAVDVPIGPETYRHQPDVCAYIRH